MVRTVDPRHMLAAMELARRPKRVTVADMVRVTGLSRWQARRVLEALEDAGALRRTGTRPTTAGGLAAVVWGHA